LKDESSLLHRQRIRRKSPKFKNKQATQKQAKADVESQKKKDAVSAKQIAKIKK
jgi:hypothetical protein